MDLFLGLLAGTIRKPLLDKLQDYLDIKKGERRDKDFEKLYATVVTGFVRTQKHLDEAQARKYFASPVTYDGVLLYLYRFTDPEPVLREQTKAALCRWAGNYKLTGSADVTNAALVARFLNELERELRADVNKTLLPYFADIRSDIALAVERILQAIKEQPTPAPDPVPEFKIHTAKLPTTGSRLFGRAAPLEMLNAAWANENTNIVSWWPGAGWAKPR